VGLTNLGSESETCVGSRVHLVGVSISFEKNFYRLPFTPPSLVRRIGHSIVLIIIELKNVFLDDKLKQASEYISVEGTLEGLHNTKNFESSRNEFDDS
jgi:hypothetical protein